MHSGCRHLLRKEGDVIENTNGVGAVKPEEWRNVCNTKTDTYDNIYRERVKNARIK